MIAEIRVRPKYLNRDICLPVYTYPKHQTDIQAWRDDVRKWMGNDIKVKETTDK